MSSKIHPTAIIEDGAKIGADVEIGPYAVVGADAVVGDGAKIFGHAMISGRTTLGAGVEIHPFAHIGGKTQDLKFDGGKTYVEIGARTVLREYVTVNCGTKDGEVTRVGADCLLMAYCHVAHGCRLGDKIIVSNSTQFAGEVEVEDWAIISGLCGVHQFCRIGGHCMIGGASIITQDIAPYMLYAGDPLSARMINEVGLKRRGFSDDTLAALRNAHKILFRSGKNVTDAIAEIEAADAAPCPEVAHLINFFKTTKRGVVK
ncbi:MAG: acyl-ACP--UDP-N-acetylglucosamine O-acyltransferase [Kiritimatiellaeota bacterium]|nr:acyl-ACP--UDP-N-acetylglucosamine O-acyltransferase [Kiritimatiellota bacterium]